MKVSRLVAVLVAASFLGCGGSTSPASPISLNTPTPPDGIAVRNNVYLPGTKTVAVGATVQWAWDSCSDTYSGSTCAQHTVTFDDGVTSPVQSTGAYSRTFTVAGQYPYRCTVHQNMTGTITVQ